MDEFGNPLTFDNVGQEEEEEQVQSPQVQQPQTVDDHNAIQGGVADYLSGITGVPSQAIGSVASFMKGGLDILSGIGKVKGQLQFTMAEAFNPELAAQLKENPEVRKALFHSMQGPELGGTLGEDLDSAIVQDEDGGVTANLLKGDFADAGVQATQALAGAIPSVMATMTGPGGLAAIGLSSLGNNFEETMEEHPEESSLKMLGTSTVKAGAEVASEYVTQKLGMQALKMLKGGAPKEAVKKTLGQAAKNVFKGFNSEGLSEAAAELVGNGVDAVAYGEEFGSPDMWMQLADSYIIGGIMGGGMSTVGEANTYTRNSVMDGVPTKKNAEYQKGREASINAISHESKNAQTPEAMESNEKAQMELKAELQQSLDQQHKVWDDMSQEETISYLQLKKDAEGFMKAAETASTPEAQEILQAKAEQKIDEADKLYETVENWEGAKTQADRIEAANRAAEVANPEAVQDHLYGQRPTSYAAKQRIQNKKLDKDLDLSVEKIDNRTPPEVYTSERLNSEREGKELGTLRREYAKFKEQNQDRKTDLVFHDEQISTDSKVNEKGEQVGGGKRWASQQIPKIHIPIADRLTGEILTQEELAANAQTERVVEKRFKEAEQRAVASKKIEAQVLAESAKRLKDQATGDKERAKRNTADRKDAAAIQAMAAEGRTNKGDIAASNLMKRNKTLIDWAARGVSNWYSPPKTIEELGGNEIAKDEKAFRGTKGVKKQFSKKKINENNPRSFDAEEVGFTVDGIRDLVMQEALKNVMTFDPKNNVNASTHIFGTKKLIQKVKQQITLEGKSKPSVGKGGAIVDAANKAKIADIKEDIAYYKEQIEKNPEEANLYNDIIKENQKLIGSLENVLDFNSINEKAYTEVVGGKSQADQTSFVKGFEAVDEALRFDPKDSNRILKEVRNSLQEGGLPSISSLIEEARVDHINTGGKVDLDTGAREGANLKDAEIRYAQAVRDANPALKDLVNNYISPLMKTPQDIEKNGVLIYNLLPSTITGKNSKFAKGFFNGVAGNKQAAALPWQDFGGLKSKNDGERKSTQRLRDAVANAVVDATIDAVYEANPEIELSVSNDKGDLSVKPLADWMNSMTESTGQKVIINDAVISQVQETLPAGSRLNGFIDKKSGEVYVKSTVGPKTVIHEMGHAWSATAKATRPDLYKAGVGLVKNSEYADIVRENYPGLEKSNIDRFHEEVLAHAIESKGEAITDKYKKNAFQKWVDNFFNAVMENLGIKAKNPSSLTMEEFTTLAASEILSGRGLAAAPVSGTEMSTQKAAKLTDYITLNPKIQEALKNPEWVKVPTGKSVATESDALDAARSIIDVANFLPSEGGKAFMDQITKGGRDQKTMDALKGIGNSLSTSNSEGLFGKDVDWAAATGKMNKNNEKYVQPQKQKAVKAIFESIAEGVKSGRINQSSLANIKLMMNNGMDGLLRDTATPKFWHKTAKPIKSAQPGFEREHNMPTTQFFNLALEAAGDKAAWDGLMDDYNVVVMPKALEKTINKTGVPNAYHQHDYTIGGLPKGYSRYFTGDSAINPVNFTDANGVSMARVMGIKPEGIEALRKWGSDGIEFSVSKDANDKKARQQPFSSVKRREVVREIRDIINLKDQVYATVSKAPKFTKVPQEFRDEMAKLKKMFSEEGASMTDKQLGDFLGDLRSKKNAAKSKQFDLKKARDARREELRDATSKIVNEKLGDGLDVDTLPKWQRDKMAKKKDAWYKRISLAPTSNNDFYGLLYKMLDKDGKSPVNDALIESLEDANYNYINDKQKMLQKFTAAAKGVKGLQKDSGIKIEHKGKEVNLSRDQAVRIYNHAKNPHLWPQMSKAGIDMKKIQEVVDYVNSNEDLRSYGSDITSTYSEFLRDRLNPSLDSDTRKQIKGRFMPSDLDVNSKQILESIYSKIGDGKIPTEVDYTPFTAEGDENLEFDELTKPDANFYSVMSGNLKSRSYGGEYTFDKDSNMKDMRRYLSGPVRTANFLDFANNAGAVFSAKNIRGMEGAFGKEWADSMRDSLKRVVTGESNTNKDKTAKTIQGFINGTIGGIMFLNARSAALQLLSTPNYFFSSPKSFTQGLGKGYWKAAKSILNSNWAKERSQGKTNLETAEIFANTDGGLLGKTKNYILEKGYALTKLGDIGAITIGGAAYMNGVYKQNIKDGMPPQEAKEAAMKQFIAQTEETQQSTRQERLGRQQTSGMGRAVLAFANTPMQYNRLTWKAIKDIRSGKNVGQNLGKVAWYMAAQNAAFTMAQQALFSSLDMEDEDERQTVLDGANSMVSTVLRGAGIYGALGDMMKNVAYAAYKADDRKRSQKAIEAFENTIPGLGTKIRQLKNTFQAPYYAQSELDLSRETLGGTDVTVAQAANATAFLTNLPTWRVLQKIENISDAFAEDKGLLERGMRSIGYNKYVTDRALGQLGGGDFDFDFDFDFDNDFEFKSPFNKDEVGQAFKDGTIEVDPNLSPLEREKTIAHEMQHVKDMKENGLDYDDHSISFKGQKFPRKNGMIKEGGKWKKEGDKSLPWEQNAYRAESPLKKEKEGKETKGVPYINETPWYEKAYNTASDSINNFLYDDPDTYEYNENRGPYDSLTTKIPGKKGFISTVSDGAEGAWDAASGYANSAYKHLFEGSEKRDKNGFLVDPFDSGIDPFGFDDSPFNKDPEWDAKVKEGKDFNHDWYNNETTKKLFAEQAPRFKGGYADRQGAIEDTHFERGHVEGGDAEYWRNAWAEGPDEHKHNVTIGQGTELTPDLVAHETTHAGSFDRDLGNEALKHLGEGKRTDGWGRYIKQPDEAYANLQQLRQKLGLRPDQRDLTGEQLQKLADEKGDGEIQAYIKNFGADNVSRAHNKTASTEKPKMKKSLKDLYSTNNKNEGYA